MNGIAMANPQTRMSDRWLRNALLARLSALKHGSIVIEDAMGEERLGAATAPSDLQICVRVHDMGFYRAVAAHGSVGAGEAYRQGLWQCDDLVGLVRLLVRNRDLVDAMETGAARLRGWTLRVWHALQVNTRRGSRRNIAAHYDLGNDFFALFLSQDLMYSSACWQGEDDTLEAASTRKLDRICQRLRLSPNDRLIEIGTGWGGLALHAARHYGCHVTTTTLSREQYAYAAARVSEAGLEDRITLLNEDYRDLEGRYDKLVSIEMIEAVGAEFLDEYFGKLGSLLEPHGLALVQAITIEDHRYRQALRAVDFIKRYIFPGSFIPSIEAMMNSKARSSDLALVHLEDFGHSYALTLRAWRERYLTRLNEVRDQGYDEPFMRGWEFYLAYCEGGFLERSIGVSQLLMTKPRAMPDHVASWG